MEVVYSNVTFTAIKDVDKLTVRAHIPIRNNIIDKSNNNEHERKNIRSKH